jgi:hypothetical protein
VLFFVLNDRSKIILTSFLRILADLAAIRTRGVAVQPSLYTRRVENMSTVQHELVFGDAGEDHSFFLFLFFLLFLVTREA